MSNHWKMLAAAVVLAGGMGSVAFADGYEPVGKGFVAPQTVNWTGVYIGGHGGYAWGDMDSDLDFGHPHLNHFLFDHVGLQKHFTEDLEGWMAGGHLGVQWQHGKWVFGVEGTYDRGDLGGTSSSAFAAGLSLGPCPDGPALGVCVVGTQSLKTEIEDLWTVTGRLGYTWNRWLAYVKGGYARASVRARSNIDSDIFGCIGGCFPLAAVGFAGSSEEDHDGWVVGAGAEYMVHKHVTLGFDYSYVNLESKKHTVDGAVAIDFKKHDFDFPAKHWVDVDPDAIHAISVRLTFLFGPEEERVVPLK